MDLCLFQSLSRSFVPNSKLNIDSIIEEEEAEKKAKEREKEKIREGMEEIKRRKEQFERELTEKKEKNGRENKAATGQISQEGEGKTKPNNLYISRC